MNMLLFKVLENIKISKKLEQILSNRNFMLDKLDGRIINEKSFRKEKLNKIR